MARINVESEFLASSNLRRLAKLLGNRHQAMGMCIDFWSHAQALWVRGEALPSRQNLELDDINVDYLISAELAREVDGGIYACGSEDKFRWLKAQMGNSTKGVQARNFTRNEQPTGYPRVTHGLPMADPLTLTPTLTPTLNNKPSKNLRATLNPEWVNIGQAWLEYAVGIFPHHAKNKSWSPETFGDQLQKVAKHLGQDVAYIEKLLDFVKHDKFWAQQSASPIGLLKKSSNGLKKIDNLIVNFRPIQNTKPFYKPLNFDGE